MTYQLPSFYDSTELVTRPMDSSATIPPAQVPVSATAGNQLQNLTDGLYVGTGYAFGGFPIYYVNTSGTNTPTSGTRATPFETLDYAIAQAQEAFLGNVFTGTARICLQAGQTFPLTGQYMTYPGSSLDITFYGDPQYGDYNTLYNGTTYSQYMTDLERPVITPASSVVNGLATLAGFNRNGGTINLLGVQVNLPAAPTNPAIGDYSQAADFIRSQAYDSRGYVNLQGSIINMTDITAYWGFLGISARSSGTTLDQFASQFQINGLPMSAANNPSTGQLAAREFFIKFYPELAGNNQTEALLSSTSSLTNPGSGLLGMLWSDVASLTVTGSKTNLGSFPISFDLTYGLRNYVFNLQFNQQNQPLNIQSSRLM